MARQQDNRRRGGSPASRPASRAAVAAQRAQAAVLAVAAQPQGPDTTGYLVYDDFNRPNGPLGNAWTGQAWVINGEASIVNGECQFGWGNIVASCLSSNVDVAVRIGSQSDGTSGLIAAYNMSRGDRISGAIIGGQAYLMLVCVDDNDETLLRWHVESVPWPTPLQSTDVLRMTFTGNVSTLYVNDIQVYTRDFTTLLGQLAANSFIPGVYAGISVEQEGSNSFDSITVTAL